MPVWSYVAVGGALGAIARYYAGAWVAGRLAGWSPVDSAAVGTFAINVAGSFLLGLIAALAIAKAAWMPAEARLFFAVGFCGAFTTFSTFSLETLGMLQRGEWWQAALYVAASNAVALLAVAGGYALGRLG